MAAGRKLALAGAAGVIGLALWWRSNPSACPYSQRFLVEAPHPFVTRARLKEILEPRVGERVLEVGPGTGYYTLPAAKWVGPQGTIEILDVQQEMLDHTMERAADDGYENVVPTLGDATDLPYADATFDAAFLVTVLGETPDQEATLRELRRVLKPEGRLVVGELVGDPHIVTFGKLEQRCERTGLHFERRVGGPLGYFARFSPT